jgi:hypothetical protein
MRISRIGVVGLAAAAMLASGAGYALAASPGPGLTGNLHLSVMTTEPSQARAVVITNGLFTAGGYVIHGAAVDVVKLPAGTFRVHLGAAVTVPKETLNPLTCLATFSAKYAITIGQGTLQYKGLTGTGTAAVNAVALFTKNKAHQCATHKNPAELEATVNANAAVTLP